MLDVTGASNLIEGVAYQFLTERCDILAQIEVRDPIGGTKKTWQTARTGVPCRVIRAGSQNSNEITFRAGQEFIEEAYKVAFEPGTAIRADSRIVLQNVIYDVARIEQALTDEVFLHIWISKASA